MLRLMARFSLGMLFGMAFLAAFQTFRLTNWVVGGLMVIILFGAFAALIGALITVAPQQIIRSSLARALTEIIAQAKFNTAGNIEIDLRTVYNLLKRHYIGQEVEETDHEQE